MRTMMMILGSAVVLGLVAAFGRLPQRAEPAAAATASGGELDAELQQLRAQTAMLSAEVATLKRQPGQLQAVARAAAEEGDEPAAPAAQEPQSEEEIAAVRARNEQRMREFFDSQLNREQPDRDWSDATSLPERMGAVLPEGSSIVSIDCGSTLCRMVTSHPDLDRYRQFQSAAFTRPDPDNPTLWRGAAKFMRLPSDDPSKFVYTAYLARENLPSLPEQPTQ